MKPIKQLGIPQLIKMLENMISLRIGVTYPFKKEIPNAVFRSLTRLLQVIEDLGADPLRYLEAQAEEITKLENDILHSNFRFLSDKNAIERYERYKQTLIQYAPRKEGLIEEELTDEEKIRKSLSSAFAELEQFIIIREHNGIPTTIGDLQVQMHSLIQSGYPYLAPIHARALCSQCAIEGVTTSLITMDKYHRHKLREAALEMLQKYTTLKKYIFV